MTFLCPLKDLTKLFAASNLSGGSLVGIFRMFTSIPCTTRHVDGTSALLCSLELKTNHPWRNIAANVGCGATQIYEIVMYIRHRGYFRLGPVKAGRREPVFGSFGGRPESGRNGAAGRGTKGRGRVGRRTTGRVRAGRERAGRLPWQSDMAWYPLHIGHRCLQAQSHTPVTSSCLCLRQERRCCGSFRPWCKLFASI